MRPDRTQIAGDDAFRFRHLLIRDTAYEALPEGGPRGAPRARSPTGSTAHAQLFEQDEIVGYHLEQAARYRRELDPDDPCGRRSRERAAERLGAAGVAAFEREDLHATRNLLDRAVALLPEGPLRRRLIPPLVDATALEVADVEGLAACSSELDRGDECDRRRPQPLFARSPIPRPAARERSASWRPLSTPR